MRARAMQALVAACSAFACVAPLARRAEVAAAPDAAVRRARDAHVVGAALRPEDWGELPEIAAAGFQAVRTDLFWERVERERGRYDFDEYDRLLLALGRNGLLPVLILDYGNPLYDGGAAPRSDEARAAFAAFAGAAAARYAGRGVIWEVWNEPNMPGFWKPAPSPGDYVALLGATAAAIRKADPAATVAGLSLGGCVWDRDFVRRSFELGLLDHVDAVSVHSYPAGESAQEAAAFYEELRSLMDRHGGRKPILCTEIGVLTHDEQRTRDVFVRMVEGDRRAGITMTIWYSWRDDDEGHFGVVTRDGRKRLVHAAVGEVTGSR